MDMKITTVSFAPAAIRVETEPEAKIEIISTGKVVATGVGPVCQLEVPKCLCWSDATPKLYTCRVTLAGETAEKKFGVCQIGWQGQMLLVNGKEVQLRGICMKPQDILAEKTCTEGLWRKVLILKDAGFNAIACDCPPQTLMEACDYYGMYLIADTADSGYASVVGCDQNIKKLGFVAEDAMDSIGTLSPACAYANTVWAMERDVRFGVLPMGRAKRAESWAWAGCQGQKMDVEVYALAASVELKLNGKSLGKKKTKDSKAVYKVTYAPGKLEAIAFNGSGNRIAGGMLESCQGEGKLCVRPEPANVKGSQVVYIPVTLEGENGVVECGADRELQIAVTGGKLLAFGSGEPGTKSDTDSCKTWFGRCLAVVQAEGDVSVTITDGKGLTASAIVNMQ